LIDGAGGTATPSSALSLEEWTDMGILDRAKEAANQALAATQQAAEKGQTKVTAMQQGRAESQLYSTLGAAFYAEQRHAGPTQGVVDALAALDAHFAEVAAQPQQPGGFPPQQPGGYQPPTTPPTTPPDSTPFG
jgi:hypothetical protein